ncbi:MAG TPA: iron-sulfur cluster repair di-iron protein [Rubricoccaceae bacterium]|nr:iron-sulfur cluster repair di-iron protein [Rubricoccaceae bacterium]
MENTQFALRTVGDLVAEDYRRAAVLKRFGIDFCCGGGRTLEAACQKKGVAVDDVMRALEAADGRGSAPEARVTAWSPGFLADYIVNEHHGYVRESTFVLRAFTQKVARVHGGARPELVEIATLFEELASELEEHMDAEEAAVFPRIKALSGGAGPASGPSLEALISELEAEHDRAGELMREIRRLSDDYTPPEGACNTYRAAFAKLEEFEDDLHRHVHLENNVLFPKALAFEVEARRMAASPSPAPPATTGESRVLDVREVPPPEKHPAIFSAFDALEAGEHFVLVNDHDPVPLRYQFEYTRSGEVGWEYVEQGPEVWRVRISKLAPVAA